jgi:hypothetical protein
VKNIPPIDGWGEPDNGSPKGPRKKQKPYFINKYPPERRPHLHGLDVLLSIGGFG